MKVALLFVVFAFAVFSARGNKRDTSAKKVEAIDSGAQASSPPKAPDFDKPENYLWAVMFGASDSKYSTVIRFVAALMLFGGQVALEFFKAMR